METVSPSSSFHYMQQQRKRQEDEDGVSVFGEEGVSMQEGPLFSDSLKELRSLHTQLYSAAEYFEVFYRKNAQKPTLITSLKDYTVEALVSTVDHLSFVTYKVSDFLREKADEVAEAEFRVFSAEQRVRSCQDLVDQQGRLQQSPVIKSPKFHKHYILPDDSMLESGIAPVVQVHKHKRPMRSKTLKSLTATGNASKNPELRKAASFSPSAVQVQRSRSLSPLKAAKRPPPPSPVVNHTSVQLPPPSPRIVDSSPFRDKRSASPIPRANPLARASSLSSRLPGHSAGFIASPARSPVILHSEKNGKDDGRSMSRGKRFLKSLLTRRRWREDEFFYSYLDEY